MGAPSIDKAPLGSLEDSRLSRPSPLQRSEGPPASPRNNPPMACHSHYYLPLKGGELEFCLKAGSSVSAGGRPGMLVEVTLYFALKFAIPSPVEGGSYYLVSRTRPKTVYRLPVIDNPSEYFSTLDASSRRMIASLFAAGGGPMHGEILGLLAPHISLLARDTVKSAEAQGHATMKVRANAVFLSKVDTNMIGKIVSYFRTVRRENRSRDGGEEGSMGTCAVCLDEVRKEWIWPVTLTCSHVFHLRCIALWLQRQNSCPLCRSKQPIIMDA